MQRTLSKVFPSILLLLLFQQRSQKIIGETQKSVEFFKEKFSLLGLEETKQSKTYPLEQHASIIMDTFKGQDNNTLKKLCAENN